MLNNVLVIDTAHRQGVVALRIGLWTREVRLASSRHSEGLAAALRSLLREAGMSIGQLDLIGVGCGPGSFTGLRAGMSFAKGLALGGSVPLVGVSSLEAYVPSQTALRYLSAFDARAGGVYCQGVELCGPLALSLEEFFKALQKADGVVSPDVEVIKERVESLYGPLSIHWERGELKAERLIECACAAFARGERGAEALYLRKTQAERKRAEAAASHERLDLSV